MEGTYVQRNGKPIMKFEIMNGSAPYSPFARSFVNVARSSRNAGT